MVSALSDVFTVSVKVMSMNIITGTTDFRLEDSAVSLGKFDGVHIGHQKLIRTIAQEPSLHPVVFTFAPGSFAQAGILTQEEKRQKIAGLGVETLIEYPFTEAVKHMQPERFIQEVLVSRLGAKLVVVGDDYRFGYERAGNPHLLAQMAPDCGYELIVVPKVIMELEAVSSTRIRALLAEGRMESVTAMLGEPYSLSGKIIPGNHIGHTIGTPTINIPPDPSKLLPPYGVYATTTTIGGELFYGITNLGVKPSVGLHNPPGAETFLFDVNRDFYGAEAEVHFLHLQRKERHFADLELLKAQISRDYTEAENYFQSAETAGMDETRGDSDT